MKLLYYYLQIILPIPLLLIFVQLDLYWTFIVSTLLYAFIYRPLINTWRLLDMGVIRKEEALKLFIPLYSTKYFYELHFRQ